MHKLRLSLMVAISLLITAMAQAQNTQSYTSVNPSNYQKEVTDFKGPLVVFFYAQWCPFSGSLLPVYADIEQEYSLKVKFCRFELGDGYKDFSTDAGKALWAQLKERYNTDAIPTLVMFNNGLEIDRMSGRPERDLVESYRMLLRQWLNSNLIEAQSNPYRFDGTLLLHKKD